MVTTLSTNNAGSGLVFEKAGSELFEKLEVLYQSAFDEYVQKLGRDSSDWPEDLLATLIDSGHVWVAKKRGNIVGAVTLIADGNNWVIDEVAVPPPMQRKGVGSWMLEEVEKLARGQGGEKLTLYTAKMRTDLIQYYQRFGFYIFKEGPPTHNLDPHVRVWMEKILVQN